MDTPLKRRIARRLKARREALGLTQKELAPLMSIENRQTLGQIENEARAIKPHELAAAAEALGVTPDYFTDRFLAAGEAAFSFRAEDGVEGALEDFEEKAGRWVALYKELGHEEGRSAQLIGPSLKLTPRSSYEDAQAAGDQVWKTLGLGRVPAHDLELALEREWGILVLYVDAPDGISGAASRWEDTQVILINQSETAGRRNFDLGHELFHLLTWDAMPPARIDSKEPRRKQAKRIEELAENFAASLLMPEPTVRQAWEDRTGDSSLTEWLTVVSDRLSVSRLALFWRLYNLGYVEKDDLPTKADFRRAPAIRPDPDPPHFNRTFIHRLHLAVETGTLSLRKASKLLGVSTKGFGDLCETYGKRLSYEV